MPREVTNMLVGMAEDGTISWESIARSALGYMSERDVKEMAHDNELMFDDEATYDEVNYGS